MVIGTVKWLNDAKSVALIAPHLDREDLLVHLSAARRNGFKTLKEGQTVTFGVTADSNGKLVGNIRPYSARLGTPEQATVQRSDEQGLDRQ